MNFLNPNYLHNTYNNNLYFQKDLRLPLEQYGIKDSELTFEQVKQMASEFIAKKQNLLCKAEEAIMLGTLIGWVEQFAIKSLDAFIDCVRSHDFANSAQLEQQFCIHLDFLSDIQISFYREKSILEAVLFSEKWRTNYTFSKYLISLSQYNHCLEFDETCSNENLAHLYHKFNTALTKKLSSEQGQLCFAHFLPDYFESLEVMNTIFSDFILAPADYITKQIDNHPNDNNTNEVQSDFTLFQLLQKYKLKEITKNTVNEELIQELVDRKIRQIKKDDFEECMYFGLASFLMFKNTVHGLMLMSNESMDSFNLFYQSIYFLTQEGFNKKKDEFNTIIFPNLLIDDKFINLSNVNQTQSFLRRIDSFYNILEEQIRKDKNQGTSIFPIVKQVSILYDKEKYIEGFDITEIPSSISGEKDPSTLKAIELAEYILERIFAPIEHKCKVDNNWTDILLLLPFLKYTRIKSISKRICELIVYIFELEHPFDQNNDQSIENDQILKKISFLFFNFGDEKLKLIKEIKGIETDIQLLEYFHIHSIQKNSPYGFSFIVSAIYQITRNINDLTTEISIKIFELIKMVFDSDHQIVINENLNLSYCLYLIFPKIVKSHPERLLEISMVQIKESLLNGVLYCRGSNPLFRESELNILGCKKQIDKELMEIQQMEKSLLLDTLKNYPSSEYGLTRSLSYFLGTKYCFLHFSQFSFISCYLQFLCSNTKLTSYKPTKEEIKILIESSISITSPLMHFQKQQEFFIDELVWKKKDLFKASIEINNSAFVTQNNVINLLLESFLEFLEKNQSKLQRVIQLCNPLKTIKNNPSEIIQLHASQIKDEQDFDELEKFTYFQKYLVLSEISHKNLPKTANELPLFNGEILNKIQSLILSLYNFESLSKIFSRNTISQLESVGTFERFERFLKRFKKYEANSFYDIGDKREDQSDRFVNAREVPFWYFAQISYSFHSIYKRPEQCNHIISEFMRQNRFRRDLEISLESFFEHHAFFGFFYKIIFKCIQADNYQCQHISGAPLPSSTQYDPRYYESELYYLEDLDAVLIEFNYFTQFLIDLLEKENINLIFIVDNAPTNKHNYKREVLIRFVFKFLKKSETYTRRLLALAYSKSSKYQRSPQTLDLINTFICNNLILHSLRVNSGRKPCLSLKCLSQFLESFKQSITQLNKQNKEITLILLDVPALYDQFGKLLALINQKVLNKYGYRYSMTKIVREIISIDVQINLIVESVTEKQQNDLFGNKQSQNMNDQVELQYLEENNNDSITHNNNELKNSISEGEEQLEYNLPESNKSDEMKINDQKECKSQDIQSSFEKIACQVVAKSISQYLLDFIQIYESHQQMKGHFYKQDLQNVVDLKIISSRSQYFSGLNQFIESWLGNPFEIANLNPNSIEEIIQAMKNIIFQVLNEDQTLNMQENEDIPYIQIHATFESLFEFQFNSLNNFSSSFETFRPLRQLKWSLILATEQFQKQRWELQQIQKQYDHCLSILEIQCKIMNKFSSTGEYVFRQKSIYVTEFNEILKLSLSLIKGLNNIVDDPRITRTEALVYQLLNVKFIKIKNNQLVEADIFYLINTLFIQQGYFQSKNVLRKKIASNIIELATKKQAQKTKVSEQKSESVPPQDILELNDQQLGLSKKLSENSFVEQKQMQNAQEKEQIIEQCEIEASFNNIENSNINEDEMKIIENQRVENEEINEVEIPANKQQIQETVTLETLGNGEEDAQELKEKVVSENEDDSSFADSYESENSRNENNFDYCAQKWKGESDSSDIEGDDLDEISDEEQGDELISSEGKEEQETSQKEESKVNKLTIDDLESLEITLAEIVSYIISKYKLQYAGHSRVLIEVINEFIVKIELPSQSSQTKEDLYKLRDSSYILLISADEHIFTQISEGQFSLVQTLANSYANKVFSIKEDSFRTTSNQAELFDDYISLKVLHSYLFNLIKNHEELIVPQFGRLIVENTERFVGNDTFVFYSGDNFFEFLIHAQLTTNYYSQDIISAVILTKTSDEVSQQLISGTMKRVLIILEKIFSDPFIFKNIDMGLAVDGIQNIFKNLLSKLKIESIEEGKYYLGIFEKIISRAKTPIEMEQLFHLELISNFCKIIKKIKNLILGEKYFEQQDKFGKLFFQSFERTKEYLEKEQNNKIQSILTIQTSADIFSSINWKITQELVSQTEIGKQENQGIDFQEKIRATIHQYDESTRQNIIEESFEYNDISGFSGYYNTFEQNLKEFTPSQQFLNLKRLTNLQKSFDRIYTINHKHDIFLEKQISLFQENKTPEQQIEAKSSYCEKRKSQNQKQELIFPEFLKFPNSLPTSKKDQGDGKEEILGTSVGYVDPRKFQFDDQDLETFGIDINEYNQTIYSNKQLFLEQAKCAYDLKQEAKIKRETLSFRENILLSKRNGSGYSEELKEEKQSRADQQKEDFKQFLKSKKFKNIIKNLQEEEQTLILQSNEPDFIDHMSDSLKKKTKKLMKQMKLTEKDNEKKTFKESEHQLIKNNKLYNSLQKVYKKVLNATPPKQQKEENTKQDKNIDVNSILSIPLLSEEAALRIIISYLFQDFQSTYKEDLAEFALNPITYLRILGLVLVITKAINSRNPIGIKWVDDFILADKITYLQGQTATSIKALQKQSSFDKLFLLSKCLELVNYLLFEIGYGTALLSVEEFIFEKEITELIVSFDNSRRIRESNQQFISLNFLKREHLNLEVATYKDLNFAVAYPSIKAILTNGFYQNIEEYISDMVGQETQQRLTLKQLTSNSNNVSTENLEILKVLKIEASPLFKILLNFLNELNSRRIFVNLAGENPESSLETFHPIIDLKSQKILLDSQIFQSKRMKQINQNMINLIINGTSIEFNYFKDKSEINQMVSQLLEHTDSFADITKAAIKEQQECMNEILAVFKKCLLKLEENWKKDILTISKEELYNQEQNKIVRSTITFFSYFTNTIKILVGLCIRQKELLNFHLSAIFPRMAKHLPNHQKQLQDNGEEIARKWWDERRNEEYEKLIYEVKDFWLGEDSLLPEVCAQFFEFIQINLRMNKADNHDYYGTYQKWISGIQMYHHFYSRLIDPSSANAPYPDEVSYNPNIKFIEMENQLKMPILQPVALRKTIDLKIVDKKVEINQANNSGSLIQYERFLSLETILSNQFQSLIIQSFLNEPTDQIFIELRNLIVSKNSPSSIPHKRKLIKQNAIIESRNRKGAPTYSNELTILVTRGQFWDSLLRSIQKSTPAEMTINSILITFNDESGYDAGGLSREFYVEIMREFMDPNRGFFSLTKNRVLMQPNRLSSLIPNHLLHFQYFGRILAKSFIDGFTPSVDLSLSFVKHIVGEQVILSDLKEIDQELEKNLQWILQNDVSDLEQDFTYAHNEFGEVIIINLIPDGNAVAVTESNKQEYVRLVAEYCMTTQIEQQIKAFLQGFYEIIPFYLIQYYNAEELQELFAGTRSFDVEDLKKHLQLRQFSENTPVIKWLLEILEEYTDKQRSDFLFFLTGQTRTPAGGFQFLQVIIGPKQDKESLPVSHTCSQKLDLPEYSSKEILKQKLEQAILEGSIGFHIG